MISVTRSALLCNRCLLARNWNKTSCQKKSSLQSSINNVLSILFHVICAMQIMLAIQPDTSTSALWNTRTQRLENISWKPMGTQASFRILRKCQRKFDSRLVYEMVFIKERNPSLNTQTVTPFVRNYLLETTFQHFVSIVFTYYLYISQSLSF